MTAVGSGVGLAQASGPGHSRTATPTFRRIDYLAPNPLGRSRIVTLTGDGRCVVRDRIRASAGLHEQRWSLRVDGATVAAAADALPSLRALPEALSRTGIPGESLVELRVTPAGVSAGGVWRRSKWLGDHQPGFDGLEELLSELARRASSAGPPEYDGPALDP